ncbi:MAG: glucuronate isomerase, partial [Clostridia bacterium]|nr:glucuronate isomerase [Clostridia bacterium]
MKQFMDETFLLTTPTAEALYTQVAKEKPIIDYHCHVSPKEIWEDRHFENITQLWLGGDHYKWRIMRSNGVDERYITGDASDREKFQKFAEALPKAIGNPMYHWCHLELKRYFDYHGVLNGDTAEEVWNLSAEKLKRSDMGVRGLIEKSNVAFIGTTDDPIDSLEWHRKIAADPTFSVTVAPSFRPDKGLNVENPGWKEYIQTLSAVSGVEIRDLKTLKEALGKRMEYFHACGCKASDHGLDYVIFRSGDESVADAAIQKGLDGQSVSLEEAEILKTHLLIFCAEKYAELGWVMQLHFNCMRNPNSAMLQKLGPDTGFDVIGPRNGSVELARLLDRLYAQNCLPRTILYSLDSGDNEFLGTLLGAFQGSEIPGKIQHGSAWWFNDNKQGMRD